MLDARMSLVVGMFCFLFVFKQKTAYEMRISDWSSDVCSSDLVAACAMPLVRIVPVVRADTKFQPVYVGDVARALVAALAAPEAFGGKTIELGEIGRASCRERVCQYV